MTTIAEIIGHVTIQSLLGYIHAQPQIIIEHGFPNLSAQDHHLIPLANGGDHLVIRTTALKQGCVAENSGQFILAVGETNAVQK